MIRYTLINVLQKKIYIYIFKRFLLKELEIDKDRKEKKNTQRARKVNGRKRIKRKIKGRMDTQGVIQKYITSTRWLQTIAC